MSQSSVQIVGQVETSVKLNVRQGSASVSAPVARKLLAGVTLPVTALVVGDTVQGNAHWYAIDNNGYVWSGGCGPLQQQSNGPIIAPFSDGNASDVSEAGLNGFGLDLGFATKLAAVILECRSRGLMFRIGQGLRPPYKQALYYCGWAQRPPELIDERVSFLRQQGAPWTADLLASLRDTPRQTDWQTNALPGAGWHQWGEAADCYCYRDGMLVSSGSDPSYSTYATVAESMGLTAGLRFSHPDPGHVQLRQAGGATNMYSWTYIDTIMKERFGEKPALT